MIFLIKFQYSINLKKLKKSSQEKSIKNTKPLWQQ